MGSGEDWKPWLNGSWIKATFIMAKMALIKASKKLMLSIAWISAPATIVGTPLLTVLMPHIPHPGVVNYRHGNNTFIPRHFSIKENVNYGKCRI
jgi:hypothetical protein